MCFISRWPSAVWREEGTSSASRNAGFLFAIFGSTNSNGFLLDCSFCLELLGLWDRGLRIRDVNLSSLGGFNANGRMVSSWELLTMRKSSISFGQFISHLSEELDLESYPGRPLHDVPVPRLATGTLTVECYDTKNEENKRHHFHMQPAEQQRCLLHIDAAHAMDWSIEALKMWLIVAWASRKWKVCLGSKHSSIQRLFKDAGPSAIGSPCNLCASARRDNWVSIKLANGYCKLETINNRLEAKKENPTTVNNG